MRSGGSAVAQALSLSWRPGPTIPPHSPEAWAAVVPTLHASASAGLGWWRVRGSALEATAATQECRNAFRLQTLDARRHEERLAQALRLFESAGFRPILAKGWSVARLYPRPGLRPYGDMDFHVDPTAYGTVRAFLEENRGEAQRVDLHAGLPRLGRSWADVEARSTEVALGATRVRVLGPEDHLALLCGHFLSHGAWRPLWLCDVALFVEELPSGFDWDYLGSLPPRRLEEVRLVALLAHRVLEARLDRTPWAPDERIPNWLPGAVLGAWGRGGHYSLTARIAQSARDPHRFLQAARIRWPNPIEATFRWDAPYNDLPRLPYQVLDAVTRGARALWQAPQVLAGQHPQAPQAGEGRRRGEST